MQSGIVGPLFSTRSLPSTPPIVLSVARFVPKKGHDLLLQAFALLREDGEEPTVEMIAQQLCMSPRKVAAYLAAGQDPVSLDMLVGEEENTSLASLINDKSAADPEGELIRREVENELEAILAALNDRERTVMRRRLGFDDEEAHVLQDIGTELHISRERVRQIEAQALRNQEELLEERPKWFAWIWIIQKSSTSSPGKFEKRKRLRH